MAKLAVGVSETSPFILTATGFEKVRAVAGVELPPEYQQKFEDAVSWYIGRLATQRTYPSSKEVKEQLRQIEGPLQKLIRKFSQAGRERGMSPLRFGVDQIFFTAFPDAQEREFRNTMLRLERLLRATQEAEVRVEKYKRKTKSGRDVADALHGLLDDVVPLYEAAGGKVTAYHSEYVDEETDEPRSPAFIRMLEALLELAPDYHQMSRAALVGAVRRWLERHAD